MLNVGKIEEGFVLDHIKAGKSLSLYHHLQLDKKDCTVAMIMNAKSGKMGKKDILKVECDIEEMDMDVLAVIDHNITVNVIKGGESYSFEYDKNWLTKTGMRLNLDPELMPYSGRQYPSGSNIFGIFADASPDRWGRRSTSR